MRKQWPRRTISNLVCAAAFCWAASHVCGQVDDVQAPQYPQYVQYPEGAPPVTPGGQVALTSEQLDQLLGPIALYPDPLLSIIFPAATYPTDIQAAEQWLANTPNPTQAAIDAQGWDGSVKALAHYPTVLKMMNDRLDWTQTLGAAFLNQQKDVLQSVQRLRAQAHAARNLETTSQEQVLDDSGEIRIEPVNPDVVYVPQYDPEAVYYEPSPIAWGASYPIGSWLDNDFDWGNGYIVVGGGWYSGWHHPDDWDRRFPNWNHRPDGREGNPRAWSHADGRPAPRVTPGVVAHLNLNRPRGSERAPAGPAGNVFQSNQNRGDVQRFDQRARPAPPAARPAPIVQRPMAPRPEPVARPPERIAAPRAMPGNAFRAAPAAAARAQSQRGQASAGRRR
jgi:hypothetical protein